MKRQLQKVIVDWKQRGEGPRSLCTALGPSHEVREKSCPFLFWSKERIPPTMFPLYNTIFIGEKSISVVFIELEMKYR